MKEKIQNFIILMLSVVIFLLLVKLLITYMNSVKNNKINVISEIKNKDLLYEQGISNDVIGPIVENKVIQKISENDITINCVGIKFATYNRINNAIYRFIIKENDKYIIKYDFNANSLINGEYTYFEFRNIYLDKNNQYEIIIEPINVTENNIITIFSNQKTNDITYSLYK